MPQKNYRINVVTSAPPEVNSSISRILNFQLCWWRLRRWKIEIREFLKKFTVLMFPTLWVTPSHQNNVQDSLLHQEWTNKKIIIICNSNSSPNKAQTRNSFNMHSVRFLHTKLRMVKQWGDDNRRRRFMLIGVFKFPSIFSPFPSPPTAQLHT